MYHLSSKSKTHCKWMDWLFLLYFNQLLSCLSTFFFVEKFPTTNTVSVEMMVMTYDTIVHIPGIVVFIVLTICFSSPKGIMRQWGGHTNYMGFKTTGLSGLLLHGAWTKFSQRHCIPSYGSHETVYMLRIGWIIPMESQSPANLRKSRRPINGHGKW